MPDEDPAAEPVTRSYVVHGPGKEIELTEIAESEVGERGELILKGADGGCAAVVATGRAWWCASVSDAPNAEGDHD